MRADRAVVLEAAGFICNKFYCLTLSARENLSAYIVTIYYQVVVPTFILEGDMHDVAFINLDLGGGE